MKTLEDLKQQWLEHKTAEKEANAKRLATEAEILEMAKNELPEKGTKEIHNGMKVKIGFTKSYDQQALMELYRSGEVPNFPFEKTFKPVNADLKYIEKNFPEQFKKIERCAVMKPAKPSFEVK